MPHQIGGIFSPHVPYKAIVLDGSFIQTLDPGWITFLQFIFQI